jgi:Sulfotransferase family
VKPVGPRFFVIGCERSGSTLLRAMLDSHPRLAVPPESYFLATVSPGPTATHEVRADSFLADVTSRQADLLRWHLPEETVRERLRALAPLTFYVAAAALYDVYGESQGKPIVGDKTPAYVMVAARLASAYPEARFVHLVRDGRDVALSLVDREHKPPNTLAQAALFWRHRVLAGLNAEAALGDRCIRVVYEDLVDEPTATLERICDHLGVDYDPRMLDYTRAGERYASGHSHPHQHRNLSRPPVRGLRDWSVTMTPGQRGLFDVLAGDVLARLGYPPGRGSMGLTTRLKCFAVKAGSRLRWGRAFARRAIRRHREMRLPTRDSL